MKHRRARTIARQPGFTLLEMMVAMAILVVLSAMAAPTFRDVMARRQADAALTKLLSDWRYARSEAIRRNDSVTVCRSNDSRSCSGADGRWEAGWIVFADRNGNGTVDAGEPVLRAHARLAGIESASFNWGRGNHLTYVGSGMAPGTNGRLEVVADAGQAGGSRAVCVNFGRVRPNQAVTC